MTSRSTETAQVAGFVIGAGAVIVAAYLRWDSPGTLSLRSLQTAVALAGAAAGRLLVPGSERLRARLIAMLGGAIATTGAFAVIALWIRDRPSLGQGELLFFALLGALPGALIGSIGYDKLRRGDQVLPAAVARRAHRDLKS